MSHCTGRPVMHWRALTAEIERHDDVVAFLQRLHGAPYALDDARTFVADERWERERDHLVLGADVRVADARSDDPNDDLVVARIVDDEVAELEGRSL